MVNNFSKGFGEPFSAGLFAHRTGRQRSRASHWTARAWGLFVTVIGWRIAKRKHARAAFSGEGARLFAGPPRFYAFPVHWYLMRITSSSIPYMKTSRGCRSGDHFPSALIRA